jgi:hypothetical protein
MIMKGMLFSRLKENKYIIIGITLLLVCLASSFLIVRTYSLEEIYNMLCLGIFPSQPLNYIPSFCYGGA